MKSKKRHHSSEDESEESDASDRSSSSESESEDSSASEHRHRKKKKRADSSDSDSDSDDHRRSKKRKHKKKKKKHVKRRRRSESVDDSRSDDDDGTSDSEGETTHKKKHKKHKHKRSKSSSSSVLELDERKDRRLHSVVKERRRSSQEDERPSRTYYQKEYRSDSPVDPETQRQREAQRFYRGSSKEARYRDNQYHYQERERNERFELYQQGGTYINKPFHETSQPNAIDVYQNRQRGPRNMRHDGRPGQPEEFQRRPRDDNYHSREHQQRGYNNQHRYNQFQERGPNRNFQDGRDNHDKGRRGPPDGDRFREREYPDRREKYVREETFTDRAQDVRRDRPPPREDRPPPPHHRNEPPRSESEDRYRDRGRRPEIKQERDPEKRDDRYKETRDDRYKEPREEKFKDTREGRNGREAREPRRDERRPDREREAKTESGPKERKSRFADAEGDKEYSWGKTEVKKEGTKDGEKEKPNFGLSGKLTADTNTVNGVVIKYTEPDDAKQPKRRWRFYPFKGDKALPILYIHRQSAFLIGRDKKVCDITLEHPSISKQHAALQYRATPFTRPDGTQGRRVRPYVIDLESANGTFVNNKKIESRRYVELLEKDVVKFGFSQREYVLLHENSKDDAQDDDNQDPPGIGTAVTTTDKIKQEKRIKQELAEDGD